MSQPLIQLKNITKEFKIPHERVNTIREHTLRLFNSVTYERFKVLDDVTLDVFEGEFIGILGPNGSGKSTLLKVIAHVIKPDSGLLNVVGPLSPFLELGVGFQPELSGRENVFLYGALLGLSRKQVIDKYDQIVAFSELERFMDQKFKNYSSGMQIRLAFAITIQAEADIFLIDEVFAVGDLRFQNKCLDVFRNLKKIGKTVLFVTQDPSLVLNFADRGVYMHNGKIIAEGNKEDVVAKYRSFVFSNN